MNIIKDFKGDFKYFSMFTGIGGFELGIKRANPKWECIGYSEIDKYAIRIFEKHFRGIKNYGNATTINVRELPDFQLLVGGFPCQAFSIAGKRRGFDDTRGTLFFEIARILRAKKPRLFILENVKGLLSHDHGNTFKTIIATLDELGYDLQWQVLNSKNFGVPQNRERVFIVGHLRGSSRPKVFPITGDNPEANGKTASTALDANYWKGIDNHGQRTMIQIGNIDQKGHNSLWGRVYDPNGVSATLNAMGGGLGAKTGLYAMQWRRTEKGRQARRENQKRGRDYTPFSDGHRELVPNPDKKVVGTITSQAVAKDSLIGNDFVIRRLTPTECLRLQGFPDNWFDVEGISDTQKYKMAGNAVTVNVVEYIASRL